MCVLTVSLTFCWAARKRLHLVLAAYRRSSGLGRGGRTETLGNQSGALQLRKRGGVDAERACLLQHFGNSAVAVDHDQQAAQSDGQIALAPLEFAQALVGLGVDFTRIHPFLPPGMGRSTATHCLSNAAL